MDSKHNILNDLKKWFSGVDENYLIGISNRGLYNRAVKDLKNVESIKLQVNDEGISCELTDGSLCTITRDIKEMKCNCPSRSICKHILMAIIYIKENPNVLFHDGEDDLITTINEAGHVPDFSPLLAITAEDLKKSVGEKKFEEILYRMDFGIEVEIEEKSLLTITFKDEGIAVRFTEDSSIKDSICSCKSLDICRHKGEAILYYQIYHHVLDQDKLYHDVSVKSDSEVLKLVKEMVHEILLVGIARISEAYVERIEEAAVVCHSFDFPNLEKLMRKLASEFKLYFEKNASFSKNEIKNILGEIYHSLLAIEKRPTGKDMKRLIGEHRSTYFDIPPLEIVGMGAKAWSSKSGYAGITFYFYSEKLKRWFTYTHSLPTYNEEMKVNLQKMYNTNPPWGIGVHNDEFSRSVIRLFNGKANSMGRLSSSEESKATILGRTRIDKIDLTGYFFDNWITLVEKLHEIYPYKEIAANDRNKQIVILKVPKWGNGIFDSISQSFGIPLFDGAGRKIVIQVQYTPQNRYLIETIERLEKIKRLPPMILSEVTIKDGDILAFPITAYYEEGEMINLTLK